MDHPVHVTTSTVLGFRTRKDGSNKNELGNPATIIKKDFAENVTNVRRTRSSGS